MRVETRLTILILVVFPLSFMSGCNSNKGGSTNPPENHAPVVTIQSGPASTININDQAHFVWQGSDQDGNLAGYYAGLDGNFDWTTSTDATYTGFDPLSVHTFKIYAQDLSEALSDTVEWTFSVNNNNTPSVTITSGPADSIGANESATFTWQGIDSDFNLAGYYAGLDGSFDWTINTTATYTGLNPGNSHTFRVFAQDSASANSDTAEWVFTVYFTNYASGQGVTDDEGDGFWTEYNVNWVPIISTTNPVDLRLFIKIKPTYGSWSEWMDSTALFTRFPGELDTLLTYELPPFAKNYYNIQLELRNATGILMDEVPYDSISSLTKIGLEDIDGFHAWFEDAWTDGAIDLLPQGNPDGYYEFIDLWWNVDAYPDAGRVKVVIFERNSAGEERYLDQSFLYEVSGFGNSDAMGVEIEAGTTLDHYDYRLELLDQNNNLLSQINYGADPNLMDIPLGSATSSTPKPTAQIVNK